MDEFVVTRETSRSIYKVTLERDRIGVQAWYIVAEWDDIHNVAKRVHDWFNRESPDDPDTHVVAIEYVSSDILTIADA